MTLRQPDQLSSEHGLFATSRDTLNHTICEVHHKILPTILPITSIDMGPSFRIPHWKELHSISSLLFAVILNTCNILLYFVLVLFVCVSRLLIDLSHISCILLWFCIVYLYTCHILYFQSPSVGLPYWKDGLSFILQDETFIVYLAWWFVYSY